MKFLFALALLVCLVHSQNFIDRILIDDFVTGSNNIVITIPNGANFPITDPDVYTDSGNPSDLLVGERDLQLTVESGPAGRLLFSQVIEGEGEWNTATPNSASGFALMQWDGKDNSLNIDDTGLGGRDFTDNGLGTRIHAQIETDVDTEYTFTIYSTDGGECNRAVTIPGGNGQDDYFLDYSSFSGNCDFTSVGAVEILVEAFDNVDSIITLVATNGLEDNSPSRTPTRTPSPSQIACYCEVPVFRCEQVFERTDFIQGILGAPPGDITSLSSYYTSEFTSFSSNNSPSSSSVTLAPFVTVVVMVVAALL